jgi:hypothetical protein
MNVVWHRWLVAACWGLPLLWLVITWLGMGGEFGGCGASFLALLTSFILFEAAGLLGLLAVRKSWLGLAALVGSAFNGWMYYATIGEFIDVLGSG